MRGSCLTSLEAQRQQRRHHPVVLLASALGIGCVSRRVARRHGKHLGEKLEPAVGFAGFLSRRLPDEPRRAEDFGHMVFGQNVWRALISQHRAPMSCHPGRGRLVLEVGELQAQDHVGEQEVVHDEAVEKPLVLGQTPARLDLAVQVVLMPQDLRGGIDASSARVGVPAIGPCEGEIAPVQDDARLLVHQLEPVAL